jgi:hypothetical protein
MVTIVAGSGIATGVKVAEQLFSKTARAICLATSCLWLMRPAGLPDWPGFRSNLWIAILGRG